MVRRARFDGMHYSAALGAAKPDAEFFRLVQDRLRCSADEIVFLDDHLPSIEAARALDWRAHHYRNAEDLHAVLKARTRLSR